MTSHDVTLEWPDGRARTIAVREDETVIEAAERTDTALPYGCLTGACGTCTGRLLSADATEPMDGEADGAGSDGKRGAGAIAVDAAFAYRRRPRALKDRHRKDGYVLLCIASPRTDCRVAVGSSVHTELVENPWK
ncbi:2Fe-2S iron-sulfur cluster-binding protein [Natrinema salaciae]|uniref:Ferredoxin n=1 Tax=Natrinema salaciae TaxID=1186196 RepID=A0A1H9I8U9_9EURY|nr:2Fe-2S iron-sulfur cluster-binding protein [Natrinema salaciae]SEQ70815.1 ferredoxin [Natrinema salaciae]